MTVIKFKIKLISDAELASGFGSSTLDSIVPTNLDGKPIIPASHIKGLMKQALLDIPQEFNPKLSEAIKWLFGSEGGELKNAGAFYITDAISKNENRIRTVTRTSLNEFGTAKDGSLRTTEAISANSEFEGQVVTDNINSITEDLLHYALLAIFEIGGSRNRGCGACNITIEGESRLPGDILTNVLKSDLSCEISQKSISVSGDHQKRVLAKLYLEANAPLCLPDLPTVGNNTICSGWSIQASAVQGMVLTKINGLNKEIADACYSSDLFRAWPLLPVPEDSEPKQILPIRASASHKISKLAGEDGKYNFCDEKIEEYEWDKKPKNLPIKSADGVLLLQEGQDVTLWKSGEMARHLSAHGVINGGGNETNTKRNLFTVESLAVKKFVGIISMPEDAFLLLKEALAHDSSVHVGKSRSIRGGANLELVDYTSNFPVKFPVELPKNSKNEELPAFIVQSPVLVEGEFDKNLSANELLASVIKESWNITIESKDIPKNISASTQILFGWNRHDKGRQEAKMVIAPGSIFVLKERPENWQDLLFKGLGGGRERGYGSVLPHPGIAKDRYVVKNKPVKTEKTNGYAVMAWNLWGKSKGHLSASQISRLLALLTHGQDAALDYLEKQIKGRTEIYNKWKIVYADVKSLIADDYEKAKQVCKVWYDLTVASDKEGK